MLRSTHERILKEEVNKRAWELCNFILVEYAKMIKETRGAHKGLRRLQQRMKQRFTDGGL